MFISLLNLVLKARDKWKRGCGMPGGECSLHVSLSLVKQLLENKEYHIVMLLDGQGFRAHIIRRIY